MPVAERFATEIIPEVQNEPQVEVVNSVPSRTKEVVQFLNSEDSSGTKRKEQVKGGENGDEKSYRANVAQQLRAARKSAREYATASKDNSIIDSEYPKQFKRKYELEKAQGNILDIERTLKQLNPGGPLSKLNEFKNKKQIAELNAQMRSIVDKYGNLTKIKSEISYSNSMTGQMANEFTRNLETLEAERTDPKEILEKYYGEKLTEFQNHQKELLRIENRKPIPIEGVVNKYDAFFMHSFDHGDVGGNTAIKTNELFDRAKTCLLSPAVSTTSFRKGQDIVSPFGKMAMIYGKNSEIYAAFDGDAGTKPIVDPNGKKNFHERQQVKPFDKDTAIKKQIDGAFKSSYRRGGGGEYNELIVVGEPVGINLFIEKLSNSINNGIKHDPKLLEEIEGVMQHAKELGLPVFGSWVDKVYQIEYTSPEIIAKAINELPENRNKDLFYHKKPRDIPFKDCITLVKEITPQDVMKMESPITWEKQVEIAKELSEKGIFDDTNLPISLRS
jgi:hypothetical protein